MLKSKRHTGLYGICQDKVALDILLLFPLSLPPGLHLSPVLAEGGAVQ